MDGGSTKQLVVYSRFDFVQYPSDAYSEIEVELRKLYQVCEPDEKPFKPLLTPSWLVVGYSERRIASFLVVSDTLEIQKQEPEGFEQKGGLPNEKGWFVTSVCGDTTRYYGILDQLFAKLKSYATAKHYSYLLLHVSSTRAWLLSKYERQGFQKGTVFVDDNGVFVIMKMVLPEIIRTDTAHYADSIGNDAPARRMSCAVCKKPADNQCSDQCIVRYCSQACADTAWPTHVHITRLAVRSVPTIAARTKQTAKMPPASPAHGAKKQPRPTGKTIPGKTLPEKRLPSNVISLDIIVTTKSDASEKRNPDKVGPIVSEMRKFLPETLRNMAFESSLEAPDVYRLDSPLRILAAAGLLDKDGNAMVVDGVDGDVTWEIRPESGKVKIPKEQKKRKKPTDDDDKPVLNPTRCLLQRGGQPENMNEDLDCQPLSPDPDEDILGEFDTRAKYTVHAVGTVKAMKRNVLYLVRSSGLPGLQSVDWSVVRALRDTGRRVAIAILASRGQFKNISQPDQVNPIVSYFRVKTTKIPFDGKIMDTQFDKQNKEASVKIWVEALRLEDAPPPTIPIQPEEVDPEPEEPLHVVLRTFASGQKATIALKEVSTSPYFLDRIPRKRTITMEVPTDNVSLEALAEGISVAFNKANTPSIFMFKTETTENIFSTDELEETLLEEMGRLDELWFEDDDDDRMFIADAAYTCEKMMLSENSEERNAAWKWFLYKFYSWQQETTDDGVTTRYTVQTRNDVRLLNFLQEFQLPLVTVQRRVVVGEIETSEVLKGKTELVRLVRPIWPVEEWVTEMLMLPREPDFSSDHLKTEEGAQNFMQRVVRMAVDGSESEVVVDNPFNFQSDIIEWEEDLPSPFWFAFL